MTVPEIMILAFPYVFLIIVGFFGWICYDSGYDAGWADKDQPKSP